MPVTEKIIELDHFRRVAPERYHVWKLFELCHYSCI